MMAVKNRKYRSYICSILLFLLLAFNCYYFFIRREVGPTYYFNKYFTLPRDDILTRAIYLDLVEEYAHLNQRLKSKNQVVFLGDSITKRFNLQEFFPEMSPVNRGIFSDTTMGILNRIDVNINNLHIEKLFIMIGYNDLDFIDNSKIMNNIAAILSSVKAKHIFVHSLLPVNASKEPVNRRIQTINVQLKQLCAKTGATFINLYPDFLDKKGGMSPIYSRDGVHPNYFGYKVWADNIETYVNSFSFSPSTCDR